MYLKRHFVPGDLTKVTHVDVLRHDKEWRPSINIVNEGLRMGWLRREPDAYVIVTGEGKEDLRYKIVAPPGTYCCHCGEPLNGANVAQAHVLAEHGGKESPSANNPAGYAVHNFWMCELEVDNG